MKRCERVIGMQFKLCGNPSSYRYSRNGKTFKFLCETCYLWLKPRWGNDKVTVQKV